MESSPTLLTCRPLKRSTLVDITQDEGIDGGVADGRGLTLADTIAPHWFIPPEGNPGQLDAPPPPPTVQCVHALNAGSTLSYGLVSLKLILGGLWSSITSTPTVVRMCPPLTTKNWLYYAPLVAVGMANGSVLIFNLSKRILSKELAVHSCSIQYVRHTDTHTYSDTLTLC